MDGFRFLSIQAVALEGSVCGLRSVAIPFNSGPNLLLFVDSCSPSSFYFSSVVARYIQRLGWLQSLDNSGLFET